MATATKSGQSLSFTYNADGLRTTKTVGGVVHTYYYSGSKLVRETYGDYVLDFFYDQNGTPFMLLQNGNIYYYITNAQGDVIRLVDINGNIAASYRYDPYGKAISALGSHANINPLRYRGYIFDHETGLYYLQSRYYDPETSRFLNADALASTGQGLLSNNMFAYCYNNPVNSHDPNGMCSHSVYTGGSVGPEGCYRCKNNQNYIDNQDDETIAKKRLGIANVGHAGCGPIAVYNAAVTMGMNVTFDEVLDYYNSHPLKMDALGLAGTSVDLIVGFFESKGYDVICAYNMDSIDALSPLADASILYYKFPKTYFIPKTSFGINAYGAHFAEYTYLGDGYYAHNVSSGNNFTVPSVYAGKNSRYDVVGIFIFEPLGA